MRLDFDWAYEEAFARLRQAVEKASAAEVGWAERAAAAIRAVFCFAAEDPAGARVLTTDALAQGCEQIAQYQRLVEYTAGFLAPGRAEAPDGVRLPDLLEEALAGGIFILVAGRLEQGREGELADVAGEAVEFALTPYLGREKARRVAADSETEFPRARLRQPSSLRSPLVSLPRRRRKA